MESILQPLRAYEHWLAQYKRVWRGTVGTSLVNPILYLTALGVGLGTLVDETQNAPGGVPYLDFVAPGLLAAAAMQTAVTESSWPVMAAIKWSRVYHAMIATPLTERDAFVGHQLFVVTRVLTSSAAYLAVITAFGAVSSWLALLVVPVAVLLGTAFSMPMAALSARVEDDRTFVTIFRFLIVPMFLFSGTFFPVSQLPLAFELVAYVTPIWHGVELCRMLTLGDVDVVAGARPRRLSARLDGRRLRARAPLLPAEAARMTTLVARALDLPGGRGVHLFERNVMSHRRTWAIIVSGFFEPLFYLLSLGYGLGGYVGDVVIDGQPIEYAAFVAPALLAASAFNGAFYDATNIFWKLRYAEDLRRRALDAARAEGHRRGGDRVRALPRPHLRGRVLHRRARARPRRVVVGGARASRDGLHRLRLRRRGDRRRHLHAELAGLRHPEPRGAADVPLLGDVLPALDLSRLAPGGRSVHTALPRGLAAAGADHGGRRRGAARRRRLPRRARPRRGSGSRAAGSRSSSPAARATEAARLAGIRLPECGSRLRGGVELTAPSRIAGGSASRNQADAAEVVVPRRPAAHVETGALEVARAPARRRPARR